jgi:hypothetical protein
LIAGVGTLLLALGIGVLIGRSGNSTAPQSNSKPMVVTVGGASGAAAAAAGATAANTTSAPGSSSGGSSHKSHKTASTGAGSSNKSSATASTAAKTVTALPPPTVTVGAKGHGAGYQNGKFTGNFFGGG